MKKILVAENGLDTRMNWENANYACSKLGNGWRLPTQDELKAMYEQLHQNGKGSFQTAFYWSSIEIGYNNKYARFVSFNGGDSHYFRKDATYYVQAVQTI